MHSASGYDQSPIAKLTPIVKEFSSVEWPRLRLPAPQSGMTYEAFQRGYPYLTTSFTEASRARISALQDAEKAWKESEADYFSRSFAWPKKSSPRSYSLKMFLQLLHEEGRKFVWKLPRWGMIVDGVLYPLRPLERYIVGKDGFSLPTPIARDWKETGTEPAAQARKSPNLPAFLTMLPTPQACDATKGPAKEYIPNGHQSSMRNLVTLAARFSTTGKILNPLFVEWLMGYQIGWTELKPWAIQWFLSKRKKRSKS